LLPTFDFKRNNATKASLLIFGIVSFEIKGGQQAAFNIINATKIF
jgi:hypothetical protein